VVRDSVHLFSKKGARFLGAAIAFYALLSAAPLFVVVLRIVGAVFGHDRAESALFGGLGTWLAPEGLAEVRAMTERLDRTAASGSVFGMVLVVYGSTRLFRALRRALNQLWGIDLENIDAERPRTVRYGVRYGGALALTLFVGVMVAVIVLIKSAFAIVTELGRAPPPGVLWALDAATSVGLTFLLFLVLFRFLPEAPVSWREAAVAALVSTVLFAIGSALVTAYVRHKHVADLYQGASAVVVAVVWVYYSAQVFFLGAAVGASLRGRAGGADRIAPDQQTSPAVT
jgi:membrane protein